MKLNRVFIIFKNIENIVDASGHSGPKESEAVCQHRSALEKVRGDLDEFGISHSVIEREHLKKGLDGDLLITIGGDGTFLAAAHAADGIPILGVNAMPRHSVGFFCATDAPNFKETIRKILKGIHRMKHLPRIESKINGMILPCLALNDILFARKIPAEMARYTIRIGRGSERQRSSGIWIASGAGSSGGIRSAGGRPMNIESKRLQYLVREPYSTYAKGYRLLKGILKEGEFIEVIPERNAFIYIDGTSAIHPIMEGEAFRASISRKTLKVFL